MKSAGVQSDGLIEMEEQLRRRAELILASKSALGREYESAVKTTSPAGAGSSDMQTLRLLPPTPNEVTIAGPPTVDPCRLSAYSSAPIEMKYKRARLDVNGRQQQRASRLPSFEHLMTVGECRDQRLAYQQPQQQLTQSMRQSEMWLQLQQNENSLRHCYENSSEDQQIDPVFYQSRCRRKMSRNLSAVSVDDGTVMVARSPRSFGMPIYAAETRRLSSGPAAAVQYQVDGLSGQVFISRGESGGELPAPVSQLVRSAADTTAASILPPLSPGGMSHFQAGRMTSGSDDFDSRRRRLSASSSASATHLSPGSRPRYGGQDDRTPSVSSAASDHQGPAGSGDQYSNNSTEYPSTAPGKTVRTMSMDSTRRDAWFAELHSAPRPPRRRKSELQYEEQDVDDDDENSFSGDAE